NLLIKIAEVLEVNLKELLPEPFQVHIENQNNSTHGNGIFIHQGAEDLLKAKDQIIQLQNEKINLLEEELQRLKKTIL
ncbi:MAG: hypothetical protein H7Y04_16520, partial [Verrucomicrobia bacterium]|nr:hypothetical protein [Cytophagales bacterium]